MYNKFNNYDYFFIMNFTDKNLSGIMFLTIKVKKLYLDMIFL